MSEQTVKRRRKRRPRGVPKALVIVFVVLALAVGGLIGYLIGKNAGNREIAALREELELANSQITALEVASQAPATGDPEFANAEDLTNAFVDVQTGEALSGVAGANYDNDALQSVADALGGDEIPKDVVLAEFTGGTVTSGEVLALYDEQIAASQLAGEDVSVSSRDMMTELLIEKTTEKILYQKAEEAGLTTLSNQDNAAIAQEAANEFNGYISIYMESDTQTYDSEEAAREGAKAHILEETGLTEEAIKERLASEWWKRKLVAHVTDNVTVTDEELQTKYNSMVENQRQVYAEAADDFEFAHKLGDIIAYVPDGYRAIKHIMLGLYAEDSIRADEIFAELATLDAEQNADRITELNAQLDIIFATIADEAAEVEKRIADGGVFDRLITEYGDDAVMLEEPTRTDGYYVCAASNMFSDDFIAAAMALESEGDVSQPVRSPQGLHIILYYDELKPGAVPITDIAAGVSEIALEEKKELTYEQQVSEWTSNAGISYHLEALQ